METATTLSVDNIEPHLKPDLFITGYFVVAWSWDLVAYGTDRAWNRENPMRDQIGFGNQYSPKYLPVLLLEYRIVMVLVYFIFYPILLNNNAMRKSGILWPL
jgi:hypothetical protein